MIDIAMFTLYAIWFGVGVFFGIALAELVVRIVKKAVGEVLPYWLNAS